MNPSYLEVSETNNFDALKPIPLQIYVSTINLGTKKDPYSMFRFPKIDPPLTKAGQLEVSTLDSLEYLINLTAGKLRPDLKIVWDQLAGRDTALKEISKSGMQLTSYDLKQECAKFKKAKEKQRYINDLNKLSAFDSKVCEVTFIQPTSGQLSEILVECGENNQKFNTCLYKIYYKNKEKFIILLQEIKKYMINKNSKKIVNRFEKLISHENPKIYKVNYFMRYITRIVCHGKKVSNTVKVTNMFTDENCGECPQIFLTCGKSKTLYNGLIDTGAQASLISFNCLKDFGFNSHDIKKIGSTLNIESSTGLVKDAILGVITIRLFIMKRKIFENSREFGATKVTFLVAAPEVKLGRIILGVPWLKAAKTEILLAEDKVRARLVHSNNTESVCSLQLKMDKNLQLESEKHIDESTQYAKFYMNAFFMSNSLSFKVQPRKGVKLPEIIKLHNATKITLHKGYPRIQNVNGLELPIKSNREFQSLTINVTLMKEPTCQEKALEEVQPNLHESGATTGESIESEKVEQSIRDSAIFMSLPEPSREALLVKCNTVQITEPVQPEKTMCNKCDVYFENCSCKKQCKTCLDWYSIDIQCNCTKNYIKSLKTRIIKDISEEKDVIPVEDQTNISSLIEDKFDAFNLVPPDIGLVVDLTHIGDPKAKELMESLISSHNKAFSTHKYDVGHFLGFEAELDCTPGSSVIERERTMKPQVKEDLKPIIKDLLEAGIIKKATQQGAFLSNSHGVSKPDKNKHIAGKADLHIMRQQGESTNHSRLTLDLRNLNEKAVAKPKINLPSYEKLVQVFKNKHVTTCDLRSMYWAIHTSYATQHLSNFYFDHHVYTFTALPMGWVNACFIGQNATEHTYSQASMLEFLRYKNWSTNSENWPFTDITDIAIIYMDDICFYSPSDIPNSIQIHANIVEFMLWATTRWGFKIGPDKFSPFVKNFKFLGHFFRIDEATTTIPPARLEAIKSFRVPRSCAETLSRLSVISYHRRYVPMMKVIAAPLQQMAMSGTFQWEKLHQDAWKALLLITGLEFASHVIDKSRPLFLCTDASQISIGWLLFQIINGEIRIINLDSKILQSSDRRKPAAIRESLGVIFGLISNENNIKSHPEKTLLLTDCIGLSCILRSKATNEKMLENALYISTFRDLHVKYTVGSSLFLCDLITRQYNKIELDNKNEKISAVWAKFSPPLKKQHIGSELTPSMLTDLLIKNPSSEYLDIFAKRAWYDQSLSRYHKSDDTQVTSMDPIPVEIDFLASLYAGFNGKTMNAQQFQELESSLKTVPAQCLAKSSHGNLNELRRTLFKLNIHEDLMEILRRKYFPTDYFSKKTMKLSQDVTEMDLPAEIAKVVRDAFKTAGVDPDTKESTRLIRKPAARRASTPDSFRSVSADTLTLESNCSDEQQLSDFTEGFMRDKHSEKELLQLFGLDEEKIRETLQPAARLFLQIDHFLKTGRILKDNESGLVLRNEMPGINIEAIFDDKPIKLNILFRLLVSIIDHLNNNQFYLFKNLIRIPYNFQGEEYFEIKYNQFETSFELYNIKNIDLENYESLKIDFDFKFQVEQLVIFEANEDLTFLAIDISQPLPPNFHFSEVILHLLIKEKHTIPSGTKIGQWKICTLQKKCKYVPLLVNADLMRKCTMATGALETFNKRKNLSLTLSRLLNLKKNQVREKAEAQLFDTKSRQIYVSTIMDKAKVKSNYLPKSKSNKPKFPYNKLLENLNTIILSQYLIKTNMALSKSDIIEIQTTDPYLSDIIKQLENFNQDDKLNEKFVIQDKILFVVMTVLGETVLRLCLPNYMCNHILTNLHENNRCHVTTINLLEQFNANFWSKGSGKMAKQVMEKCLHCKLNTSRRKMMVKGTQREFQRDETPGRIWTADLLYLPRSSEGFRFCLVLTERLTSYICGLPLKTLNVKHVSTSFAQFLSIMPPMEILYTDHGRGDFGAEFTKMLVEFGIRHAGGIPNRSQVQGNCEVSNKILTNQLARIVSSEKGKLHWHVSLPKAIQVINSYHPYKIPFSRTQLLFSPFIFQSKSAHMALNNPVQTIKRSYGELNNKRIMNLLGRRGNAKKKEWDEGAFVLINDESQTGAECRGKLNVPYQSRVYKIIQKHHDGFTYTLLDLLDGSKREVVHSRLMGLDLATLESYNYFTPGLYTHLQKLTDVQRNRFQAPKTRQKGLKLITDLDNPTFERSEMDYLPEKRETLVVEHQDALGEKHREAQIDKMPSMAQPTELEQVSETEEPNQRITRFRGAKHVPVFTAQLIKNRSILKVSPYSINKNFQVEIVRTIPADQFQARKRALALHKDICQIDSCQTCKIAATVKGYIFNPADFSKYVAKTELLHNLETLTHKKVTRRVFFNNKTLDNDMKPVEGIEVNIKLLVQACTFNVSFRELINYRF